MLVEVTRMNPQIVKRKHRDRRRMDRIWTAEVIMLSRAYGVGVGAVGGYVPERSMSLRQHGISMFGFGCPEGRCAPMG